MTKILFKKIMTTSRLCSKYNKNCIDENLQNYEKQRSIFPNILKKAKTYYFNKGSFKSEESPRESL